MSEVIIEVRPVRGGGWKAFEGAGVEPVFGGKDPKAAAISYARTRAAYRKGEIRVYNTKGDIAETIAFDELKRRL